MVDADPERRRSDGGNTAGERERPGAIRDVLASRRRQVALEQLLRAERPVSATELARSVAVAETDLTPADVPVALLQQIYLELTREHVPALDAIGVLEYDGDSGHVRLDADPATIRRHLEAVRDGLHTSESSATHR